jgi:hypothetical protein
VTKLDAQQVGDAIADDGLTIPDDASAFDDRPGDALAAGGDAADEPGRLSGFVDRLKATDPHHPIGSYDGLSLNPLQAGKHAQRGIEKAAGAGGWPAYLDFGMAATLGLYAVMTGQYADDGDGDATGDGVPTAGRDGNVGFEPGPDVPPNQP